MEAGIQSGHRGELLEVPRKSGATSSLVRRRSTAQLSASRMGDDGQLDATGCRGTRNGRITGRCCYAELYTERLPFVSIIESLLVSTGPCTRHCRKISSCFQASLDLCTESVQLGLALQLHFWIDICSRLRQLVALKQDFAMLRCGLMLLDHPTHRCGSPRTGAAARCQSRAPH